MIIEGIHLVISIAVIVALWAMDHREISTKILISLYIGGAYIFTHYYKKLFNIKIKEVIEREKEVHQDLIENHKIVVDEMKTAHWENMNSKQSEIQLYQKEIERLENISKQINSRYEGLIDKIEEISKGEN